MTIYSVRFLYDTKDILHSVSRRLQEHMLFSDRALVYRDFANRRVRFATVLLSKKGRQPERVHNVSYDLVAFDTQGAFDVIKMKQRTNNRLQRILADAFGEVPELIPGSNIVSAGSRFEDAGFSWTPSSVQELEIIKAAFGEVRVKRWKPESEKESAKDLGTAHTSY